MVKCLWAPLHTDTGPALLLQRIGAFFTRRMRRVDFSASSTPIANAAANAATTCHTTHALVLLSLHRSAPPPTTTTTSREGQHRTAPVLALPGRPSMATPTQPARLAASDPCPPGPGLVGRAAARAVSAAAGRPASPAAAVATVTALLTAGRCRRARWATARPVSPHQWLASGLTTAAALALSCCSSSGRGITIARNPAPQGAAASSAGSPRSRSFSSSSLPCRTVRRTAHRRAPLVPASFAHCATSHSSAEVALFSRS